MQRGDIVACTSHGFLGAAIRHCQKRDHEEHWDINHIAVLNEPVVDDWTVYQAEAHGVTDSALLSSVTHKGRHFIIPFPDQEAVRSDFLEYITDKVGDHYDWVTIFSDALNMYLPDPVIIRRSNTYICSGLAGAALLYAGYPPMVRVDDIYSITPASIISVLTGKNPPTVAPK
jgi:hypothetical protein